MVSKLEFSKTNFKGQFELIFTSSCRKKYRQSKDPILRFWSRGIPCPRVPCQRLQTWCFINLVRSYRKISKNMEDGSCQVDMKTIPKISKLYLLIEWLQKIFENQFSQRKNLNFFPEIFGVVFFAVSYQKNKALISLFLFWHNAPKFVKSVYRWHRHLSLYFGVFSNLLAISITNK